MSSEYIAGLKSCVENDVANALAGLQHAIGRAKMLGAGTSLMQQIGQFEGAVASLGQHHTSLMNAIEVSDEYRHWQEMSYVQPGGSGGGGSMQMHPLKPMGPVKPAGPMKPSEMLMNPEHAQTLDRRG